MNVQKQCVAWSCAGILIGTSAIASAGQSQTIGVSAHPPSRWAISAEWGPDNAISGKIIKDASGQTTGGVPINLDETTYDEVYGRLLQFKVGVAYLATSRSEAVLNFIVSRSGAETVTIGSVGAANVPVSVNFTDMDYWGFEGGQRFLFSRARIVPYAGYLVGINRYGDIRATLSNASENVIPGLVAQDGKIFEKSWAFSAGPTGGVLVDLGPVGLTAEMQFKYMGGLSDVDWLVEQGLRDINDESSRWSFPVMFGARFRF